MENDFNWGQISKVAPIVALLILALWAGHKGIWFFGHGARIHIKQIEKERDDWRALALVLLRKSGIHLPETTDPGDVAQIINHETKKP